MQLIRDLETIWLDRDSILTIGAFDGVHRGHQALARGVVEQARGTGRYSVVITFHPHPANVLSPAQRVRYITAPEEKVTLFARLGVDIVALLKFTPELAQQPADAFVWRLVEHLRPKEIWIGQDFALGRDRGGNAEALQEMGRRWGFSVRQVEPVVWNGSVVSSSRIRNLLAQGELEQVSELLGWYYTLAGRVVHGQRRGHALGFPTANIRISTERALPRDGVYACFALLGEQRFPAVANLGVRPMFEDDGDRLLEVYLLDMEIDLYGCDLAVEFVRWLRPEMKFPSIADLIRQIQADITQTRATLRESRPKQPPVVFSAWEALRQNNG